MAFDPTLRGLIAQLRSSREWDADLDLRLLRALWPKLVGPAVAGAATVAGIRDGVVLLSAADPIWERQLRSMRAGLLRRLNEPWPNRWITDIRFVNQDGLVNENRTR